MSRFAAIPACAGALFLTLFVGVAPGATAADSPPIRWAMLGHEGDCTEISELREFKRMEGVAMTLEQVRSRLGATSAEAFRVPSFERAYRLPLAHPQEGALVVVPLADCPKRR